MKVKHQKLESAGLGVLRLRLASLLVAQAFFYASSVETENKSVKSIRKQNYRVLRISQVLLYKSIFWDGKKAVHISASGTFDHIHTGKLQVQVSKLQPS